MFKIHHVALCECSTYAIIPREMIHDLYINENTSLLITEVRPAYGEPIQYIISLRQEIPDRKVPSGGKTT